PRDLPCFPTRRSSDLQGQPGDTGDSDRRTARVPESPEGCMRSGLEHALSEALSKRKGLFPRRVRRIYSVLVLGMHVAGALHSPLDRKSTRLNSSHVKI